MLVMLPKHGYKDTSEGGLSFWIIAKERDDFDNRRNVTCEGKVVWMEPDVCLTQGFKEEGAVDCAVLIGSTGLSLWSDEAGEYFQPSYKDLTVKGQQLFDLLGTLFGDVHIVTLLDT